MAVELITSTWTCVFTHLASPALSPLLFPSRLLALKKEHSIKVYIDRCCKLECHFCDGVEEDEEEEAWWVYPFFFDHRVINSRFTQCYSRQGIPHFSSLFLSTPSLAASSCSLLVAQSLRFARTSILWDATTVSMPAKLENAASTAGVWLGIHGLCGFIWSAISNPGRFTSTTTDPAGITTY